MPRRNGPVVKSVESVLRLEGSLWWERFVKEVSKEVSRLSVAQIKYVLRFYHAALC